MTAPGGAKNTDLATRQRQFNAAMARFNGRRRYQIFSAGVAIANIVLQLLLLVHLFALPGTLLWQPLLVLVALFVADFINGLVHMIMDHSDRYNSIAGPLIANFHLHHKIPRYQDHSLPLIYFNETGSKVWLVPVLGAVLALTTVVGVSPYLLTLLIYVGLLSSVAEVSHYLCHNSTAPAVTFLAACGLLLPKRHHARHHLYDNQNYAFLNGWSDPLLNRIAAASFPGYKGTTDLHFATYVPPDGEKR